MKFDISSVELPFETDSKSRRDIRPFFDWKNLPIPKNILGILKSGTKSIHQRVLINFNGDYIYLDPAWPRELEEKGFPVTKDWSGLEDTNQITNGELEFIKKSELIENEKQIYKKFKINSKKRELNKFYREFYKWIYP